MERVFKLLKTTKINKKMQKSAKKYKKLPLFIKKNVEKTNKWMYNNKKVY